jgi:capsular polysaccharide biosynthesis protein
MRPDHQVRIGDFRIRPSAIDFLRGPANPNSRAAVDGSRIFMARPDVRRRYNQEEVFDLLRPRGFTRVSMEELPWTDQRELVSRAEVIVGPSGAAWTNLAFCSEGAKCVSWLPSESDQFSAYSTLASIVGADLRYVTYQAGVSTSAELYSADYVVDLEEIDTTLDALVVH